MMDQPDLAEERCEKLRIMIEHADQVILGLYDAGTTELLEASPYYLEMLERIHGYPRDSLIGRRWQELAPTAPGESPAEMFRSVIEAGAPRRLHEVHLSFSTPPATEQASETVWDITLTPIRDASGGGGQAVRYVVISAVEVTGRVQARQELERAARAKDLFFSMASHELRTPLVPLMGYAEMLSDLAARKEREENPVWDRRIGTYIGRFQKQLERLNQLLDDMFDVARLQSGRLALKKDKVDLARIVRQAVENTRLMSERHKLYLTIAGQDRPWLMLGDEQRLLQALSRLLQNAIIHAPESERIDVRMMRLRKGGAEGDEAIVEVQDYGPGTPPDELASLFTPFYQASPPRVERPKEAGLGLGLYIVRGVVEGHSGAVDVRSAVGEGSTFVVRLPLL